MCLKEDSLGTEKLLLLARLLDQGLDGFVQFLAGRPLPLVANHSSLIDEDQRRPSLDVPGLGNRPTRVPAVPERTPSDLLIHERLLESIAVRIAVDAEDD